MNQGDDAATQRKPLPWWRSGFVAVMAVATWVLVATTFPGLLALSVYLTGMTVWSAWKRPEVLPIRESLTPSKDPRDYS